jgi:hypothetical protein
MKSKVTRFTTTFAGSTGVLAPALWFYQGEHGQYLGDPGSPLNWLVYFFPSSVLFLSAPLANDGALVAIAIPAIILNIGLYALIAFLLCSLPEMLKSILGNSSS